MRGLGKGAARRVPLQEPFEDDHEEAPASVVERLVDMETDELRAFAEEHGIDISGLEEKPDLVDAISLHPGIARILREAGAEGEEAPPAEEEVDETPEEPSEEPAPAEPPAEEPDAAELRERVEAALRTSVDFSALEQYLSEAATKFSERNFDTVMETARAAALQIEEVVREYAQASWAFALASTERMLEGSPGDAPAAEEAEARLQEARQAFQDGTFVRAPDVLERLSKAALHLHANQMEAARDHVTAQEETLEGIQAMGGDTTRAQAMLRKAKQALDANQRAAYADMIREANRLVGEAREERIRELQEKTEGASTLIEEAASIGADVGRPSSLLEDARQAFDTGDFAVVHDLLRRAEKAALDAQKEQMDRVAAMREQQLQRVKDLIAEVKPAIDRARGEGFKAKEALADLKAAGEHTNAGDYVNALMKAKRAYGAVKAFHSELEARRIEESTVMEPPEEPPASPQEEAELPEPEEAPEAMEAEEEPPVPEEPPAPQDDPRRRAPTEPMCISCGSTDLRIKRSGKAKCQECGRKFRV